jgi:hypothetical protein
MDRYRHESAGISSKKSTPKLVGRQTALKPDELVHFDNLARHAAGETPPSTEVADRVLQTLRKTAISEYFDDRKYAAVGVGSIVAACAAIALFTVSSGGDAFIVLAEPFITVWP